VERHKATLKIRKITRKSHTKLHIYSSDSEEEEIAENLRNSSVKKKVTFCEGKRERGKIVAYLSRSRIPVQTIDVPRAISRLLWRRRLQLTRQDPNFAREPERKEGKRPARRGAP